MKRPTRNAVLLFTGEVLTRFLGFLVSALLARRLGIDGFGQVGFAVAITSYGVAGTKLGLLTVGIRDAAQDRSSIPRLAGNILPIRLLLAVVATGIVAALALVIDKPADVKALLLVFGVSILLQSLLLEWVFNGLERMEYPAVGRVITYALYFGFVAAFVRGPAQLLWVPVAFGIGTLGAVVFLAIAYTRRFGPPKFRLDTLLWRYLALRSWPVGLASVLSQFYVSLGIVGLSLLRTYREAGLFTSAHRLVFFLLILDRVFQSVFLPAVSRYYKSNQQCLPQVTGTALRVIVALSLPVCVGLSLLARQALTLVFGASYSAAAPTLTVLCWFLPLSLLTTLAGYSLLASGRERRFCRNTALGVGLAVALAVPGIRLWGSGAAAAVMLLGEAFILVLMGHDFLRSCRPVVNATIIVPFVGCVLLAGVVLLLRSWSWPVAAIAGAMVYFIVVFLGRGLTVKDLGLAG